MAYIKKTAVEVIQFVKSHGIEIRFSSEDSFRSDLVELVRRPIYPIQSTHFLTYPTAVEFVQSCG